MEPYNTNKGGGPVAQFAITKDDLVAFKQLLLF
jgi:hypothetical protein